MHDGSSGNLVILEVVAFIASHYEECSLHTFAFALHVNNPGGGIILEFLDSIRWAILLASSSATSASLSTSAFTREDSTLEKGVNILLNGAAGGVAHEHDLTICVDEQHVWYTLDTVLLISLALAAVADVPVLNFQPILFFDVIPELLSILVD